ncbi:MAG TPA: S4 domain-containing protein [bacterium]|nr:S4 domain-containing protein [bacterium]
MRLDKFLQVSRLVRRRALANRLCDAGRVTLNGRRAEPAAPVRAGDVIAVDVGDRRIRARVREVPAAPRPDAGYCDILTDEPQGGPDGAHRQHHGA